MFKAIFSYLETQLHLKKLFIFNASHALSHSLPLLVVHHGSEYFDAIFMLVAIADQISNI